MFRRFREYTELLRDFRVLHEHAAREARRAGAATLESEHLFAAIADGCFGAASKVLTNLGISYAAVLAAIDRERAGALALAGVRSPTPPLPAASHDRLKYGQSAMRAAERSIDREPEDTRLRVLLGIVLADRGVMPRLLQELGVTSAAIVDAVQQIDRPRR